MNKKNMNKKILIGVIVFFAITAGVFAFKALQPAKPTIEEANVILEESLHNTLGLSSFTTTGGGFLEIKDNKTPVLKMSLENMQASVTEPFDFAKQDLDGIFTYNIFIDFNAMAGFVEKISTPEELENIKAMGEMFGIDILSKIKMIGKADISVAMEMKTINLESYTKIAEISGVREVVTQVGGIFLADMVMSGIEEQLGVWTKTPFDPDSAEEIEMMSGVVQKLLPDLFGVYYVKKVLPNTEINGKPVYNIAYGVDLDKVRNVLIKAVGLFDEIAQKQASKSITQKEALEFEEELVLAINKNWPKITKIIQAMEINSTGYICKKKHLSIKETATISADLSEIIAIINSVLVGAKTNVSPEEKARLVRIKNATKNMSIAGEVEMVYSEHNEVPTIVPPTEYKTIESMMLP